LQIAHNVALREFSSLQPCENSVHHHFFDLTERIKPNFVWTTLREPATRANSHYWFGHVSKRRHKANPQGQQLIFEQMKNFQTKYIGGLHARDSSPRPKKSSAVPMHTTKNNPQYQANAQGRQLVFEKKYAKGLHARDSSPRPKDSAPIWTKAMSATTKYPLGNATISQVIEVIREIMDAYHFIGLSERMDESLVVLKLILELEHEDIVTLFASKQAGGFFREGSRCNPIVKGDIFPEVIHYMANDFQIQNYDYFLYAVANRSLDLTIEELGRERVDKEVQKLKMMRQLATDRCKSIAAFPCTKAGPLNILAKKSCYNKDWGCGHECVHQTLKGNTTAGEPDHFETGE